MSAWLKDLAGKRLTAQVAQPRGEDGARRPPPDEQSLFSFSRSPAVLCTNDWELSEERCGAMLFKSPAPFLRGERDNDNDDDTPASTASMTSGHTFSQLVARQGEGGARHAWSQSDIVSVKPAYPDSSTIQLQHSQKCARELVSVLVEILETILVRKGENAEELLSDIQSLIVHKLQAFTSSPVGVDLNTRLQEIRALEALIHQQEARRFFDHYSTAISERTDQDSPDYPPGPPKEQPPPPPPPKPQMTPVQVTTMSTAHSARKTPSVRKEPRRQTPVVSTRSSLPVGRGVLTPQRENVERKQRKAKTRHQRGGSAQVQCEQVVVEVGERHGRIQKRVDSHVKPRRKAGVSGSLSVERKQQRETSSELRNTIELFAEETGQTAAGRREAVALFSFRGEKVGSGVE